MGRLSVGALCLQCPWSDGQPSGSCMSRACSVIRRWSFWGKKPREKRGVKTRPQKKIDAHPHLHPQAHCLVFLFGCFFCVFVCVFVRVCVFRFSFLVFSYFFAVLCFCFRFPYRVAVAEATSPLRGFTNDMVAEEGETQRKRNVLEPQTAATILKIY